jgi:hypothetical protein
MSPEYVRPYVKAQKNDDRDAEGIAEAAKDADERPGGMSRRRHDQPGHAFSVSGAGRSLMAKRRPAEGDSAEGDNAEGKYSGATRR